MNGDEVRAVRFRGGNAGGYVGVDDLLRHVAAELDEGRPVGPLIKNAKFRRVERPFAKGYDVDSVDWFLDQLLLRPDHSGLAGIGTDPWHDLDVAQLARSEVSGPALRSGGLSWLASEKQFAEECANAWRDFGQAPGTSLWWGWVARGGTLAERWDGTTWRITPTPNPAGAAGSGLNGVTCTSPVMCIAVGVAFDSSGNSVGTVTERWDGTTWSIQPTPTSASPGAFLNAVSCTSPNACTAVGNTASGLLAERWDGTAWTVQSTPSPPGTQGGFFTGVSCTSQFACTAVGAAFDSSGNNVGTITERWDGTTWSIQPTPTSASPGAFLNAVSCTSPNACTAVGNTASALLAERWDGTTWTVQPTPTPPGTQGQGDFFGGVWCSSPSACTAVGLIFTPAPFTVAERWDGNGWTVQDTPNLPGAYDIDPPAVSCPTLSICTAVGGYTNNGPKMTLAEQWNRNGGSAPVAGNSQPTPSSSVRSCTLPLAAASLISDRMVPSLWFRSQAIHARPVSSRTAKPPNLGSGCGN